VAELLSGPIGRLVVATLLGAVLGVEREYHGKVAGLRTNVLITLGAALFTLISVRLAGNGSENTRIAAQIVTGIGFLGGGAILRSRQSIHGLTTAATIWVNSAIGMAAAAGEFTLAVGTTMIALIALVGLEPVERALGQEAQKRFEEARRDKRA
jgi:putative Mg2+ transporter-C (MgtC) family protein